MKSRFIQLLSLLLAGLLQLSPLMRTIMPAQGLAPSAWGFILKLGVGATALLGFDAVSQASSIAISPPNATVGQPYIGTISYSGSHSGSVSSMSLSNNCIGGGITFLDGLTIVYAGGNKATVTGTPTAAGNFAFSIKSYDKTACGTGGNTDTRAATLVVAVAGGGATTPTIASLPNTIAQVGAEVQLSGAASGNPTPQYQWWSGLTPIAGATNSVLTIPNVQLTNAGVYTLTASNSQTVGGTIFTLPKANCFLSVCYTGGTNYSTFNYPNYAPAGVALTMASFLTNGTATTTNYYQWIYNQSPTPILSTGNTLPLAASILTPAKSGTYTVTLNSTNASGAIISGQNYDSYWAFGYRPAFTNSLPAATNVSGGANVTFTIPVRGSLNVYNSAGAGTYATNNTTPCVFWFRDNSLVASQNYVLGPTTGATYSNSSVNATITLNNVSAANNGNYTVVVTNLWGSLTSSPVALTVASAGFAPVITTPPPAALALLAGQSASISVTATGTPALYYQWRQGTTDLGNGGVYGGTQTNTLTLTGVNPGHSGSYTVVITNSIGAITSSIAAVNIALPPAVIPSSSSPGNVQFNATTVTGITYVIEQATDLAFPVWKPVYTNNTGVSGALSFSTNTASGPQQFFRVQFP